MKFEFECGPGWFKVDGQHSETEDGLCFDILAVDGCKGPQVWCRDRGSLNEPLYNIEAVFEAQSRTKQD